MGLEEVKSEILDEAEAKADHLVQEAEEEKEKILDKAKEEAEEIREEHMEELEDKKDIYKRKAISTARMKAKEEKLHAREENISKVFEEFRNKLGQMSKKEKKSYVESCLEKPKFDIGKVIGSEDFEELVDKEFEEEDSIEGIVVVSEYGNRRQNFSFDKIAEQFKSQYRREVAEKLFE